MQSPEMKNNQINYFAETNFRNRRVKFGIKVDDRRRHMYLIGKTGMGKSTMLENMVLNDIYAGNGLAYVDPHGDSVEKFLDFIPSSRINDVVYFDPSDIEYPIAFNILETVDQNLRHIVASGLIGVFKKLWADSWGPRLEYLLRNAILALLDYPGSTLLGVLRILTDKSYRQKVIERVKDPVVKAFWVDEYSKYPDKFAVEAMAPIQNKVGQFLSNFLIRNIVGQVKSTIDLRELMDDGKIILLNLSKGRIGEDTSALLGAMIITKIQLAAMSRVNIAESTRRDFYLYVDEFQNFATESFANILSEARKYRLNLTIAHQYIEQLDERVQAAVFGNVGTIGCFRVGATDAEVLVKEFTPHFTEEDMVNLTKYDIYLRLMIDGIASEPFSATALPPIDKILPKTENREKVLRVSRERYSQPRSVVEEKIIRWSGVNISNDNTTQNTKNFSDMSRVSKPMNPKNPQGFQPKPASAPFSPRQQSPMEDVVKEAPADKLVETSQIRGSVAKDRNQNSTPVSQQSVEPMKKSKPSDYLEFVAREQAVKGIKKEKDLKETNPDAPTPGRPYPAQCFSCNRITYISFMPDGQRPIYCKNCLRDVRLKKAEMIKNRAKAKLASPSDTINLREDFPPSESIDQDQSQRVSSSQNTIPTPIKATPKTRGVDDSLRKSGSAKPLAPGNIVKFN